MSREIISKKTRNLLREFLVGWTLKEIEIAFDNANITPDRQYSPVTNGVRRTFVEQLYHSLDFQKKEDAQRFLTAAEGILKTAFQQLPSDFYRASIETSLNNIIECLNEDGFKYHNGKLMPSSTETKNMFNSLSEVTRRGIFKAIRNSDINWWGELQEDEFLGHLYELDTLPSNDHRPQYNTFKLDLWQHRVNNLDWSDDWIFSDSRFDLLHGSDKNFTDFLCRVIYPVVRPNEDEAKRLLSMFNSFLQKDGWEIIPSTHSISGKPVYTARPIQHGTVPLMKQASAISERFDYAYMKRQISRMNDHIETDPENAIGAAKEFVETCFKTILRERGKELNGVPSIPDLSKAVLKELKLAPEDVENERKGNDVIKKLLNNLASLGQSLGEIRNLYGTGHGKHAKSKSITPRHAKLAVGVATTLGVFLFDTHQEQVTPESK